MIDSGNLIDLIRSDVATNGKPVDRSADISLLFELAWRSGDVVHTDCRFQRNLNLWRDCFPPQLGNALADRTVGERVTVDFDPGQLLPAFENASCIKVDSASFKAPAYRGISIRPAAGRFYPRRFIAGVKGIDRQDVTPMRVTAVNGKLDLDLNHPLACRALSLTGTLVDVAGSGRPQRGGLCRDVAEQVATDGPGMQARWNNQPTDFWSAGALERDDPSPDREFYARPRFVSHIDATASHLVGQLYRQWIPGGARVLDLMASWDSHLPDSLAVTQLTGLGMNQDELAGNERMDDFAIHDLNDNTCLPFEAETFDAVICTLSVEYLVRPLEVFVQVGRVLKPGGRFIVTFSNRWFPPKAVRIWETLHDYERMGLVLEYFMICGLFSDLRTWSLRGLPRPADDKYADRLSTSDPVYAVCGTRAPEPAPDR